jgi:hypothetical protein
MVLSLNNICHQVYRKRNPIYHFYEEIPLNATGLHGAAGDKHYKCFHGARKVLTITKAMQSNLNGERPIFIKMTYRLIHVQQPFQSIFMQIACLYT